MNLAGLIKSLREMPSDASVYIASPDRLVPMHVASYRGYYEDLAIGYATASSAAESAATDLALRLEAAVGATFEGYKGGQYVMGPETRVWVSNIGQASTALVTDVYCDNDIVYIGVTMRRFP